MFENNVTLFGKAIKTHALLHQKSNLAHNQTTNRSRDSNAQIYNILIHELSLLMCQLDTYKGTLDTHCIRVTDNKIKNVTF